MKIVCIGDSLTEGDYGIFGVTGVANVQEKGYPYFLKQLTGADIVNAGRCGYRTSDYLEYYKAGSVDIKDADLVIIMLGTNGGLDKDKDTADNRAFYELMDLIDRDVPSALKYLCTPPHATEDPYYCNCGYAPQVRDAVGFVWKMAGERNLPVIDLASCPDFGPGKEKEMQPNDGLHYSEKGYSIMAGYIYDAIKDQVR